MRVLHVHHDPSSLPGLVGEILSDLGAGSVVHQVCSTPGSPEGTRSFPDPSAFAAVVLYGSRWSVPDSEVAHWVEPEIEMVRAADSSDVPVLGLCFGGQLLAAAHGAGVGPAARTEIGWLEVEPSPASPIESGPWLQWHFDAFEVPAGATELARSPAGPQAFALRRNLGLQFHPEADRAVLEAWMADDVDQLVAAGVDADGLLAGADEHAAGSLERARRLIRWWWETVGPP